MSMIVGILENFLGTPISHYEGKSQVQFDCPMCSADKGEYGGDGKGNLAINYGKGVYKCWSCWERNNMFGPIIVLIKKYGNQQHLKDYELIAPEIRYDNVTKNTIPTVVKLPESFKLLSKSNTKDYKYAEAFAYVNSRGIDERMIEKYNIGFTVSGPHKNRIIIPSYDTNGTLNYFIARSWDKWNKFKYLNPEAEKELIIFNEKLINWNSTIYLTEGAFDHIVTPNSIPLLGKFISDKLFFDLQTKANCDVVIALDGGKVERADALILYKKLNTLNLYNRVKIIHLEDEWDLSLLNEKHGKVCIINHLKSAFKFKESRL
jgi:DNA primase